MRKLIVFDMDGTIADLYGVENWLEGLRAEQPFPYLNAEPMVDINKLIDLLIELKALGWEIAITSWLSMNSTQEYKNIVRQAKKAWLKVYQIPYDEIHLVQYGTPKQKCTKADIQILFDDSDDVRNSFENTDKGRYTINPQEEDIIEILEKIIENF